jgi:hypothetical protein
MHFIQSHHICIYASNVNCVFENFGHPNFYEVGVKGAELELLVWDNGIKKKKK